MVKIAVIGGGSHSQRNHLPALARYISLNPGEVEFVAFCDLRHDVAEDVSRQYGVRRLYTDPEEMLTKESLDGCIAVTPIPVTAPVARQVISSGTPLLMEKPPGISLEEAEDVCVLAERRRVPVMVSMNRRFNPVITAACSWHVDRPRKYLRATMLRHNRRERDFFLYTAIHCVDAVRMIAGDVRDTAVKSCLVNGVRWYHVSLEFTSGATGVIEVMPDCGSTAELYEMFGAGYRLLARLDEKDAAEFVAWESGRIAQHDEPARGMPLFVANGTYGETVEFLAAIKENRPPHPTLTEVLQSVELCCRIQQEVETKTTKTSRSRRCLTATSYRHG